MAPRGRAARAPRWGSRTATPAPPRPARGGCGRERPEDRRGQLRDGSRAAVGRLEPHRRRARSAPSAASACGHPAYDENVCCASSPATRDAAAPEVAPQREQLEERDVLRLVHHEVRDRLRLAAAPRQRREEEQERQVLGVERARDRFGRVLGEAEPVQRLAPLGVDAARSSPGGGELQPRVPDASPRSRWWAGPRAARTTPSRNARSTNRSPSSWRSLRERGPRAGEARPAGAPRAAPGAA